MNSWWATIFRNKIITSFALEETTGKLKIVKHDLPFEGRGMQTTKTRGMDYWRLL